MKVKAIKLKSTDNFGQRFKECREYKKLLQNQLKYCKDYNACRLEKHEKVISSIKIVNDYVKSLDIKEIRINISNKGEILRTNTSNIGINLKNLRNKKGLSLKNMKVLPDTTLSLIERTPIQNSKFIFYIDYAKALGIKTLIINID